MKLVIVTALEEYQEKIKSLFEMSGIENFSSSDIEGHKVQNAFKIASLWFAGDKGSNESSMFFSFTEEQHIDKLFEGIKEFNNTLDFPSPIRAIVIPIEKFV